MLYQIDERLKENLKQEISLVAPNAQAIDVNVIKNSIGEYKTKIRVRLKGKIIYAEKLDRLLLISVKRCYRAVLKQLDKVKSKRVEKNFFRYQT